jgi:hypothetical protein
MIRVAEKCGFIAEGIEREVLRWDGAWGDLHHFGMTEDDYARMRKHRKAGRNETIWQGGNSPASPHESSRRRPNMRGKQVAALCRNQDI